MKQHSRYYSSNMDQTLTNAPAEQPEPSSEPSQQIGKCHWCSIVWWRPSSSPVFADPKEEIPAASAAAPAEETSPSHTVDDKSETPVAATANGTSGDADSTPKLTKKPTIGSSGWFQNVDPFAKGSSGSDANAEQSVDPKTPAVEKSLAETGIEKPKTAGSSDFPPNHLGEVCEFNCTSSP